MAETVIAATLELDSSKATKSIKEIKSEISEATLELKKLKQEFGETSEEATKTADRLKELKSTVKEVGETTKEAKPQKTFEDFEKSVNTVITGVRALNGTMQLLGMGSKDVEEALKKVEGALDVVEKITSIKQGAKEFASLKNVAVDAFNAIKTAIGGTGIGLLVVAVAAIYANWDKIKGALTGVNSEQQKNLATATENATLEKEKLAHIDDQDNILKSQGKSEKEILELKAKQVQKTIAAAEAQLSTQKIGDEAAQKTAKRNRDFLADLLKLSSAPLEALTLGIDAVGKALGQDFGLNDKLNKGLTSVASLVFDPDEMKEKADKSYKEQQEAIDKMKNQQAGYQNQITQINDQAFQKRKAFEKELRGIQNEGKYAQIADAKELAELQLKDAYNNQQEEIKRSQKTQEEKNELLLAAKTTYEAKLKKIESDAKKEEEEEEKAAGERLKKMREENQLEAISDKTEQNKARIEAEYEAQRAEIEALKATAEIKKQLLEEAQKKYTRLLNQNNTDNTLIRIEDLKNQANDQSLSQEARLDALNKWQKLTLDSNALTEKQKTQTLKENADARKAIEEAELAHKKEMVDNLFKLGDMAAEFAGKNTLAGKVLAVTAATISTYLSAQKAYESQFLPVPSIDSPIRATIAAAVAVASGLATIKKIVAVQVPGAPGGTASIASSAAAPLVPKPQAVNTQLPQDQINQMGNATVRAYVLEQDIDQDRSRTTRLNRAARLGG